MDAVTLGSRRTWWNGLLSSVGLLVVALGACAASAPPPAEGPAPRVQVAAAAEGSGSAPKAPAVQVRPVALTLSPPDQAAGFAPGEPITVTAVDGRITQVALTGQDGRQIRGELAADGRSWRSAEPLGYGKTYTTTATAQGDDGKTATATSTFSTATARRQTSLSMNPLDGQTVGVGQPLAFYFDTAIADKAAAERAIQITTTPAVEGGFYWFDDREVHWRPRDYWKTGTQVTINAAIYGKNLGNGVFGREDRRAGITIGDSVIAIADGATHQMSVTINGTLARTIPISMGKKAHETPVGTYVLMSEHTNYIMDSSTYGVPVDSPQGYRTKIAYASRMSNSGVFYHSAPWSVGDQGRRNVSHGCINMSVENARWMQSIAQKGDIVIVNNSGGPPLEVWDGLGDWQLPWDQWLTGGKK